jgi:hypothetical protein
MRDGKKTREEGERENEIGEEICSQGCEASLVSLI